MRLLRLISVFTPEPWQGYGYGAGHEVLEQGFIDGQEILWGDTHHPALSETNGEYDGQWLFIGDKATGTVTAFDPADPDKKAVRAPMADVLLPMADGYGRVMQTLGPPRALGGDTVAGRDCTVLRWQIGPDRQDWCVDSEGIVLRAVQTVGPVETKFEALTIRTGEQPETLFRLPEGFTVEER